MGRILVMMSGTTVSFYGLKVAIRYACMRTQFGLSDGKKECSLIDYQLHQHRLFPHLAKAMCGHVAASFISGLWKSSGKKIFKPKNFRLAEIHAMVSCMKAQSTWDADKTLKECRECCGGFGFSHYSRIGEMKQFFDINQTWEGDNNILLQQTGKFLLEIYRMKMMGKQKKETLTCEWISLDAA